MQNKMMKKNEMERKFIELQKAHTEQSIVLQNLQEEIKKIKKYKKTAAKQEEVIEKLESLMKEALRESRRERAMIQNENALLRESLQKAQSQVSNMKKGFESGHYQTLQTKIDLEEQLEDMKKRLNEFERIARQRPISTPPKSKRRSTDVGEIAVTPIEIRRRERELLEKDPHIPMVDLDTAKKQPIRHSSTGSYRRPSPRLIPIDSSLSARSSMKTSED